MMQSHKHSTRLVDALLELGVTHVPVDRPALAGDLERPLAHYYSQPIGDIALGPMKTEGSCEGWQK
jgi:hypothetical protein